MKFTEYLNEKKDSIDDAVKTIHNVIKGGTSVEDAAIAHVHVFKPKGFTAEELIKKYNDKLVADDRTQKRIYH